MKRVLLIGSIIIAAVVFGCPFFVENMNGENAPSIESFEFKTSLNPVITSDVVGVIHHDSREIVCFFPITFTSYEALIPSFSDNGSVVYDSGVPVLSDQTVMDFGFVHNWEVVGPRGETSVYRVVCVSQDVSSVKVLSRFTFLESENPALLVDGDWSIDATTFNVELPTGTDITALKASLDYEGFSLKFGGIELHTDPVPICDYNVGNVWLTAYAADSSFLLYKVNLKFKDLDLREILSFSFEEAKNTAQGWPVSVVYDGTIDVTSVEVHIPTSTVDMTALEPSVVISPYATVVPAPAPMDFSTSVTTPVLFTVTSQKGKDTIYSVRVYNDLP